MSAALALCRALTRRLQRDSDTPEDARRKELVPPIYLVGGITALLAWADESTKPEKIFLTGWWGMLLLWATTLSAVLGWLALRVLPLHSVAVSATVTGLGVLLVDWHDASVPGSGRAWPLVVLFMDVFLAIGVHRWAQRVVLHSTAAWLLLSHVEDGLRLGLYDVPHWTDYPTDLTGLTCSCADPPCATGLGHVWPPMMVVLLVLYIDFVATRGFAEGLRAEQARILASVEVSEQVAANLSHFDLHAAQTALQGAGEELPPRLRCSFARLLRNLARYRPYLPQSCFEQDEDSAQGSGSMCSPRSADCGIQITTPLSPPGRSPSLGAAGAPSVGTPGSPSRRPPAVFTDTNHRHSHILSPRLSRNLSPKRGSFGSRVVSDGSPAGTDPSSMEQVASMTGHIPRQRMVTLLSRNATGLLQALAQVEAVGLSSWLAAEVQRFAAAVQRQGGVSDLLSGDHLSASFGALRVQGTQKASATRAAIALSRTPVPENSVSSEGLFGTLALTAAVCSGRALCGDFGSAAVQRFMVIGGVSSFVPAVERCAAAWGTAVLIDSAVQSEAEISWDCRLRKKVRFPKLTPQLVGLWEVVAERQEADMGEWMYQLESMAPNPWAPYSAAVARWCDGEADQALVLVSRALDRSGAEGQAHVRQGLIALSDFIQAGAPAPLCELTAAAMVGAPAPVAPVNSSLLVSDFS